MATVAITNTLKDAQGVALANVNVVINLVPRGATRINDGSEVTPTTTVATNSGGVWTANLEQSSNISPAGSYYEVDEQLSSVQGGPRMWAIRAPAAPATLAASLYTVPVQ